MPTVRTVERQIRRTEGFDAHFLHPDGRDVRGDRENVPSYRFRKAAADNASVADWRRTRFTLQYPGFDVEVVDAHDQPVHGATRLRTVRASY